MWVRRAFEVLERHPVLAVGLVAGVARLAVALISFVASSGYLIPDEAQYVELADTVASGRSANTWTPVYGQQLYDAVWPFIAPLRLLFDVFGSSRIVGQLWVVPFGVAVACATTALARTALPTRLAVGAGVVVALTPSQVLWTSVVLREGLIWSGLVAIAAAVTIAARSQRAGPRVGAALLAAVSLWALGSTRPQTTVVAALALVLTVALMPAPARERLGRLAVAVAIAVAVPALVGLGPAGVGYARDHTNFGTVRAGLSLEADSAIGDRPTTPDESGGPDGDRTVTSLPPDVVADAEGNRFVVDNSAAASIRAWPAGVLATLFRPTPLDAADDRSQQLAATENLWWVALYGVAVFGLPAVRRRPDVLLFPLVVSVGIVAVAGLTQGNFGTAFRHRGQILWAVALLAAAGLQAVAAWRSRRTAAQVDVSAER